MSSLRFALLLALAPMVACDDPPTYPDPGDEQQTVLSISPKQLDLRVGDLVALRISGATTQLLAIWTSDNPSIASVSTGGLVHGKLAGQTMITVTVGDQSASVPVYVH